MSCGLNFVGWKNGLLDVMNLDVRKEFNSIKDELEGIAFYPGDRF
jgi:hypothetical protein